MRDEVGGAANGGDVVLRYAGQAVPRYTSYPTAPHFRADVDDVRYRRWLERLDPSAPVSLYLHVPFCSHLCWYCGCNMRLAARYETLASYVDVLLEEIELLAETLPSRMAVSHLHWGGGTPTTLRPDDLERVMSRINDRFDFAPQAEIAIEADPRGLTREMMERLGALGFNRASFGVQEFDPDVQAAINRIQPPELVASCVDGLRGAGVSAVNFDLIYGLPRQTADKLERTAERCLEMQPDRIALFGYAHVPWMAKKQRMISEADLPGAEERLEQSRRASRVFAGAGYAPIGIDHFALPSDPLAKAAREGRLRRNFQGYTTDAASALLGIGATSIGKTPQGYVQNIAETGAWARTVLEGRLPIAKGVELTDRDRLRAHVIEQIMCSGVVDLATVGREFAVDADWWDQERSRLRSLEDEGVVTICGGRIEMTEEGDALRRVVAAVFDEYLGAPSGRHSRAV